MNQIRRRIPLESWALLFPPMRTRPADLPTVLPVHREVEVVESFRKRGHPIVAWLVIVCLVALVATLQAVRPYLERLALERRLSSEGHTSEEASPNTSTRATKVDDAMTTLQVRIAVGAHAQFHGDGRQFVEQFDKLRDGTPGEQLQYAIYVGELVGPAEALRALRKTRRLMHLTAEESRLADILWRLYTDYSQGRLTAPDVSPTERDFLQERLGWAGELALAPAGVEAPAEAEAAGVALGAAAAEARCPDPEARREVLAPARRAILAAVGAVVGGLGLLLLGFFGLLLVAILALSRQMRGRLFVARGNGGLYAETFAVWLALFLFLGFVPAFFLPPDLPAWLRLAVSLAGSFLSLSAVFWPVLRGLPWQVVRREIGWSARRPLAEVGWGVAWYVMSLPLLAVGLIFVLILMASRGVWRGLGPAFHGLADSEGAHPIIGNIREADPLVLILIFVLASVAAPIIEETFFRGVLYRHLREATGRWGVLLSVLVSGGLVSFIFAVIHPQGLIAVPVLMALAFGFTLAREARGSLLPCMVAHGVHNGLIVTIATLMLSG